MTRRFQTLALLACGLAALLLGPLGASPGEAAAQPPANRPGDAAMNHWAFRTDGVDKAVVRSHAQELVEHLKQAHPEVHLEAYDRFSEPKGSELHFFLETVNTRAQRMFIDQFGQDDTCRELIEREDELFELTWDRYMRLVASDPEKERRMGPQAGVVVWTLRVRFPRVGQALDCIEAVVRHLNATYPQHYFRAYDEWFPSSSRVHIHVYGTGIAPWEATEAEIRRDPVFRELMSGAAEAFVEGSFDDIWLANIAR